MIRRGSLCDATGNVWYARLVLAVASAFGLYFAHTVGLEVIGYTGPVREMELLVWLAVATSCVACYCWYHGSHTDRSRSH